MPYSEIASIQWSPEENLDCSDCLSPTINPLETTGLTVTVTTHDGCVDQASIQIFVEKNVELLFPNAFSPNEDGNNDYFFPFTTFDDQGIKEILSFQIFNRWGEMVFENYNFQPNDPAHGWDGYFRAQTLNPAVFVYYATVQLIDGNEKLYKGDVVLKR